MTNINALWILIFRTAIIPNQWCRENLETIQCCVYFELQISTQKSTFDKNLLVLIFQILKWAKIALLSSLKGKGLTDWRCTNLHKKVKSLVLWYFNHIVHYLVVLDMTIQSLEHSFTGAFGPFFPEHVGSMLTAALVHHYWAQARQHKGRMRRSCCAAAAGIVARTWSY